MRVDCGAKFPRCSSPPIIRKRRRKKWFVYAKETFGGSRKAFHYLSRYTHRVAISNHLLVDSYAPPLRSG